MKARRVFQRAYQLELGLIAHRANLQFDQHPAFFVDRLDIDQAVPPVSRAFSKSMNICVQLRLCSSIKELRKVERSFNLAFLRSSLKRLRQFIALRHLSPTTSMAHHIRRNSAPHWICAGSRRANRAPNK